LTKQTSDLWPRRVERELGQIHARLDQIEQQQTATDRKVTELRDAAIRVRGGWWTISTIAAIGAALGAMVARFGLGIRQ